MQKRRNPSSVYTKKNCALNKNVAKMTNSDDPVLRILITQQKK